METVGAIAAIAGVVGIPFRLKEMVRDAHALWRHIYRITDNPKMRAALEERLRTLCGILDILEIEPDEINSKLIFDDLQSVKNLLESLPTTSGSSTWRGATEDHKRLQEAEKKLESLIQRCTAVYNSDRTVYKLTADSPSCKAGLSRSATIFKFLETTQASNRPLTVIVIHGQAGLGKSTLLDTVWDTASSKHPFKTRAYVQLGEGTKPEDITNLQSDICHQLGGKSVRFPKDTFGQKELKKLLKSLKDQNKPVFLAIDNVFEVKHLTSLLPSTLAVEDMPSSSCISVTCRDLAVGEAILRICHLRADDASQVLLFRPPFLGDKESEKLFAESAEMNPPEPAHQDLLGALVPLCGGLPLALKVLGCVFADHKQREPERWRKIQSQWVTFKDPDNLETSIISNTLSISYNLLPSSRQVAFQDVVSSFYGWPWELVEGIIDEDVMVDLRKSSLVLRVKKRDRCSRSALSRRWQVIENVFFDSTNEFHPEVFSGFVWMHDLTLLFGENIIKNEVNRLGYAEHGRKYELGYAQHPFTSIDELPEVTGLRNVSLSISSAFSIEQLLPFISSLQCARRLQTLSVELKPSSSTSIFKYRLVERTTLPCPLRYFSLTGLWGEAWSKFLKEVHFGAVNTLPETASNCKNLVDCAKIMACRFFDSSSRYWSRKARALSGYACLLICTSFRRQLDPKQLLVWLG